MAATFAFPGNEVYLVEEATSYDVANPLYEMTEAHYIVSCIAKDFGTIELIVPSALIPIGTRELGDSFGGLTLKGEFKRYKDSPTAKRQKLYAKVNAI